MAANIFDSTLLLSVSLGDFSQEELLMLKDHLIYAAGRLQSELQGWYSYPTHRRLTFHQLARLLRWRAYFSYLAETVERAGTGDKGVDLSTVLFGQGRQYFLDFLRSERYRAEAAAHSIKANSLQSLVKQDLVCALDIEARFYNGLLHQITTPHQLSFSPADEETIPLLFVSLPKPLIR